MRTQLVKTVESLLDIDSRIVVLLGDIGVFGFRDSFKKYPERVINIGILEPTTIGLASGLAKTGLIPLVHTIAPFLVERSFEQLKIDFGYQCLGGNFISVGASYDYASLGCTHHCPGDVGVLKNIPNMQIIVPGTGIEFDRLFRQTYDNQKPTYIRLSEQKNIESQDVEFGKANIIKRGSLATVVVIGPALQCVVNATEGLDVSIIYYTTIIPFDKNSLSEILASSCKILLVEPFYTGTLTHQICQSVGSRPVVIKCVGVPNEFLTNYGSTSEHNYYVGLTPENVRLKLKELIND